MRQQWIQDLIDKIDIADLFQKDGHIVGNSGKVNCPFHHDKNPSCQIYDNGFYCFGCGKGGSAIDYVMLRDGVSFWEAFKTLASMYNHPLPTVEPAKAQEAQQTKASADKVFSMLKDAFIEYNANLTPQDRQYLQKRGLIDETINKELIGYAGSNGSLANLVKKYPFEELQKTGLFFVSKNGSLTEFYQRRFVFPYWRNGQIVYSIGRLDTDVPSEIARLPEWNQGKYIKQLTNSKKHPYVSECIQNVIWNADMAQQTQTGVIAEGIIDGLLFKQEMTHRFKQGVISPVTTKFRKQDIESLSKICNHWKIVYLIPDAEESEEGMKGAITTAEQLYEKGITKVCIVEIPCPSNVDKVDLADILNFPDRDKACEDLKALMDNAKDYLSLQIENARTLPDVEKDEAIRKIVKCLRRVDETSYMYQRYVSALAEKPALVQKGRLPLLITKAKEEEARKENINVPVSETEITNALLERKFIMDGNLALFYYRQDWYKWNGKYYKLLSTPNMRAYVAHFIKHETDAEVTSWTVGNVLEEMQGECTIYDDIETPAWVRGPFDAEHAGHILVFENGWLDFGAFLNDKEVELNPHTPLLFATYALPFSFDPDAECKKWLTFLDYNMEGDSARIAILQEFLGYCLIWHTGLHKFLILEGEAGTGKSTVTKVFTAVLGWENVSHVPLEMFGERFGLYPTLGKLANIVGEVGELDSVAEAQLKAFVGGDPMMFDRKHKDPIEAAPTARLILATNNRPRFIDRSEGIWRRLMLIPFNRKVPEEKIIMDFDKQIINEELAGVFMWAFEGLYRLLKNGRFTTSELVEKEIAEYKLEGNPAKAFLLDYYEEGAGEVIIAEIYHEYKTWCEEMGFSPLNSANFGKEVFRVFPKVERKPKKENGKFLRVYTGLVPKR